MTQRETKQDQLLGRKLEIALEMIEIGECSNEAGIAFCENSFVNKITIETYERKINKTREAKNESRRVD